MEKLEEVFDKSKKPDELLPLQYLSSMDFERFALNIIEYEAEAHNKELYREKSSTPFLSEFFNLESESKIVFDAIAPYGIDDSRFTVVEVKKTSKDTTDAIVLQIERIVARFKKASQQSKRTHGNGENAKLLIVISSGSFVKQAFLEKNKEELIEIWSIEDLVSRAKSYPFEYNAFLELVASRYFSEASITYIKSESEAISDKEFEEQNNRLITELSKSFEKNRICLVLGSGVSMDYNKNLSWEELSKRLYDSLYPGKKFIDEKKSIAILGGDTVSSVQYSKRNLGNRYSTVLYKLIYPQKNAYVIGDTSLDACVDLIRRKRADRRQTVTKVITYNYDDYLEQALIARSYPVHALYRASDFINESALPIYHVHGYMPEGCKSLERQEYSKTVILSEEDYFDCYGDSSNWNVAIQLETFKDDVCLFVGNSITDFNEKRLLNRTRQEKEKAHFAIICTKGLGYSDLTKIYMHFFYELNVKIIWAKKISDIPMLIKKIK